MPPAPPRVFISYSHDSPEPRERVLALADHLRRDGIDAGVDRYESAPPQGWPRWMEQQIEQADFVLLVSTETYGRRFRGDVTPHSSPSGGLGVRWEGAILTQNLYENSGWNVTYIPVVFTAEDRHHIPLVLRPFTFYDLSTDAGYEQLYRRLTSQPDVVAAPLGRLRELPPHPPVGPPISPPRPRYPDETTQELAQSLEQAYQSRALLVADGKDTTDVNNTILDLRRRIREGGQLKEGDFLLDGRFQLLETVGHGGFAQVWKAYDTSSRDVVAIKVLHGQHTRDESRRERFFRGARHMARLQHPRIVRVVEEECEDGGYYFFVMEYVGGADLRQAVKAGRLAPEERLRIILEVGEALAFAHERGVIHRDVKPGNVLLDTEGRPKLTDFDLVRAADTTGGTRTTGLGTFLYAAPEAMMDAKTAAEPADVYGLGMTAVFALHGADLPPEAFWELPRFVDKLEVNEGCRRVLQRAVVRKVEDRWASVAEFCRALRRSAEDPPPTEPPKLPSRPRTLHRDLDGPVDNAEPAVLAPTNRDDLFQWIVTPHDGRVKLWREIPAGEGWIGSPQSEEGRYDVEGPRYRVTILRPFEMAAVPVTNAQYAAFDPDQADAERPDHPVVGVTWDEAVSFCHWLAEHVPGCAGTRLATEEEWEYACRAGTETRYWSGDSEEALAEVGWYSRNSGAHTHRVGEKRANLWGLYDMHGNVWEWTQSPWANNYSEHKSGRTVDPSAIPAASPADLAGDAAATPGGWRVIRGGSCGNGAALARSAYRSGDVPWGRLRIRGFRLVRPVRRPER